MLLGYVPNFQFVYRMTDRTLGTAPTGRRQSQDTPPPVVILIDPGGI